MPIEARPTSPPDALLRDADVDVVAALGARAIADLRRLYLRAAVAAKRCSEFLDGAESTGDVPPRRTRRS